MMNTGPEVEHGRGRDFVPPRFDPLVFDHLVNSRPTTTGSCPQAPLFTTLSDYFSAAAAGAGGGRVVLC